MRRALRIVAWIALGSAVAVASFVLFVLVALRTDWGKEKVRAQLEQQLEQRFVGDVSIGRIEGTVLSRIIVHDLVIHDAEGNVAIRADSVTIDYDLKALYRRAFRADEVILVAPEVHGRRNAAGELNLAHLIRKGPPAKTMWTVEIGQFVVVAGQADVQAPDGRIHAVTGIAIDAAFKSKDGVDEVDVRSVAAHWVERATSFTGSLRVERRGGEGLLVVRALDVSTGDSRIAAPVVVIGPGAGQVTAYVDLALAPADIRLFAPSFPIQGPVTATGLVSSAGDGHPWWLGVTGSGGGASFATAVYMGPPSEGHEARLTGELRVSGLDPRVIDKTAPRGDVAATITVDLTGSTLDTLRGRAGVTARGRLDGLASGTITADARLDRGKLDLNAALVTNRGRGTVDARLHRDAKRKKTIVDRAHVSARGELGAMLARRGGAGGAAGQVKVELDAHGPTDALAVRGRATGTNVRSGTTRARTVEARFDLTGLPGKAHGTVELRADGVRSDGEPLGGVRADVRVANGGKRLDVKLATGGKGVRYAVRADATVRRGAKLTEIDLGDVMIRTRGLTWTGHGGSVHLNGHVGLHGIALKSSAGTLEFEGDLEGKRHGKLHVHALGLNLGKLQAALGLDGPPMRGVVTVDGHVSRGRGRYLEIDATGHAVGLAWKEGARPVDARLDMTLARGRLRGTVSVKAPKLGEVSAELDTRVPRDPLDGRAWRRLAVRDLRSLTVTTQRLDLTEAAALAGRTLGITGRVTANVTLREGARSAQARLEFHDVAAGKLRGVRGTIDGTIDGRQLTASFEGSLQKVPLVSGDLTVAAGLPALRAGGVKAFLNAPANGTIDVRDFPLPVALRTFDLKRRADRIEGRLTATARLDGSLAKPVVELEGHVAGLRAEGIAFDKFELAAKLDEKRIAGRVIAVQKGGGNADVKAEFSRAPGGPMQVAVAAKGFELAFLAAFVGGDQSAARPVTGRLDAQVTVAGPRSALVANGHVHVSKGSYRLTESLRPLRDAELDVRLDHGKLVASLSARSGPGRLDVKATGLVDGIVPRRFEADIRTGRLPLLAGRLVARIDSHVSLKGTHGPAGLDLKAVVMRGQIHLPKEQARKLHDSGSLEDVVYVDERGQKRREQDMSTAQVLSRINLSIDFKKGVAVKGQGMDALIRGAVTVAVAGRRSEVRGEMEVVSGRVELFGRRYEILRARAGFDGSHPPNPWLQIRLAREFNTVIVYIDVDGTMKQPRLALRSDPPSYDQAQLLGFVLGGNPDDPAVGKRSLQDRGVGIVSGVVAGQVQKLIQHALPIDVLRLESEDSGAGPARVTVGKWLTEDLFLAYRHNFVAKDNENTNEATFEYRFLWRWFLEAHYGDRGDGGADILWIKRY